MCDCTTCQYWRHDNYCDKRKHKVLYASDCIYYERKTTVNDIIGLVKTEERTDSVELKKELYK